MTERIVPREEFLLTAVFGSQHCPARPIDPRELHRRLQPLGEREQAVLAHRIGCERFRSLAEVSRPFHTTPDRVVQLEAGVVRRLRHRRAPVVLSCYH